MIKEAVGTGTSIDEAKENALLKLGAKPEDDVSIEVLETYKKKSFGLFGGTLAKVRAFMEVPDEEVEEPKKAEKAKENIKEEKAEKDKSKKSADSKKEKIEIKNKNEENSADEVPKSKRYMDLEKAAAEGVEYTSFAENSPEFKASDYLKNVLDKLGCTDISLKVSKIDGGVMIDIAGEGLGVVIGHRGETLDALQHLASLASNAGESGYFRVVLNTGDYRQRREQTLISLANKMAAQAIKTHKCRTLEPMNPYERRVIHTAVQNIEGVSSTSFGEGAARRVVIAPDGVTPRPRMERRGGRYVFDKSFKNRSYSKPSKLKREFDSHEKVKDSENIPLYGKIEL